MISYLKGTILIKKAKYLILAVNNIGYRVFVGERALNGLKEGSEASLYIHHHVTENSQELYGFPKQPELELFNNLLSVSGVGPKSAINVLSAASAEDIIQAIVAENPEMLKTVTGIGTKTAEKIVVELKSKIGSLYKEAGGAGLTGSGQDVEIIEGLLGLGYSRQEIMATVKLLPTEVTGIEPRLKAALKLLAK